MPLAFRRVHIISVDQKVVISPNHICNNPRNAVNSDDPNRVHILWISYFTDKFQWYDISNTKVRNVLYIFRQAGFLFFLCFLCGIVCYISLEIFFFDVVILNLAFLFVQVLI